MSSRLPYSLCVLILKCFQNCIKNLENYYFLFWLVNVHIVMFYYEFFLVQTFSDCLAVLIHLRMLSKDEPAGQLCRAGVVNSSAVNIKAMAWMRDSGTHCNLISSESQ